MATGFCGGAPGGKLGRHKCHELHKGEKVVNRSQGAWGQVAGRK